MLANQAWHAAMLANQVTNRLITGKLIIIRSPCMAHTLKRCAFPRRPRRESRTVQTQQNNNAPPLQANELNQDKLRCPPPMCTSATAVGMMRRRTATAAAPYCRCRRQHDSRHRRRRGYTLTSCKRQARRKRGCFGAVH